MSVHQFPAPLPSEHLLSCLMRFSHLKGWNEHIKVAKLVSNNVSTITTHYYWRPVYSDILSQYLTKFHEEIVVNHTLLNIYANSASISLSPLINELLLSPTSLQLKFDKLEQVHAGWKWCPECAKEDEEMYSIPFWHRDHQFSLKKQCTQHNTALLSSCPQCQYRWKSVLQGPPPVFDCPKCGHLFLSQNKPTSELDSWIEQAADTFIRNEFKFDKAKIQNCFKERYGLTELKQAWSLAERKHIAREQEQFAMWLNKLPLSKHITPLKTEQPLSTRQAFNVSRFTFNNENISPLVSLIFKQYWTEKLC